MLMEIEDFKNNNGKNNTADRNIGILDSKIKSHDIIPTKAPDNRYFVQREGIEHAVEKLSPPKMKRRVKDLLNEQNNTKNSQTTDFSKKVLPEVHKDCNCGSPKNGKGSSSSSSSSIPLKHDHIRSSSKSRDEVHKCSPNSNKNINRQHRTDQQQQQQQQQSKAIPQSQSIDNEPIHMSWDEVMQEAKMLGIPLKSQNKLNDISNQRVIRTGSEKSRQGKNFYSDGDDCNRINNRQDTTSVASSASSIGLRHAEHKKSERSPQTFKGIIKLQNFFKKLELRHKSPCHCQSNRTQKIKEKRESSPRSFLREVLMPQKVRDHGSGKMVFRSHNTSKWDCEECMKKCKYCRSIERMSLKEKSRDDDEVCSISMVGSWQPETSFDQLSLPIKSSSLNRNSKNISYQGSCYSLSSKSQHVNFSSRSFNAEIGTAESDISLPDPRGNEKEHQSIKTVKTVPKADKKLIRYDINPQDNLRELKYCLWYWGSLDRESSNEILRGKSDGSYLLRNSSDDRYVLALSFRSQGVTHHTGIEYSNGHYTFHERSPPIQPTNHRPSYDNQPKENIVCFIERASNLSKSESDRYYLQPRSSEEAVVPVKLWTPMLRPVESLRNLATDIVVGAIGKPDFIASLPVIATIKRQVKKRFQTKVVK